MNVLRSCLMLFVVLVFSACQRSGVTDLGYHPHANPSTDLAQARELAAQTGRKVLIIAGGDWCRWCHVLQRFLERNRDVQTELDRAFVVLKVYIGDENVNEQFFSGLPEAVGYPHFWVMASDGTVLKSIDTAGVESGPDDYDKNLFLQLIRDADEPN